MSFGAGHMHPIPVIELSAASDGECYSLMAHGVATEAMALGRAKLLRKQIEQASQNITATSTPTRNAPMKIQA